MATPNQRLEALSVALLDSPPPYSYIVDRVLLGIRSSELTEDVLFDSKSLHLECT